MKKILSDISHTFITRDGSDTKLTKYMAMKGHDGWKVHEELLLTIRAMMAQEMLSKRFTQLSKEEKDVKQRSYFQTNEIVKFLLNPAETAKGYISILKHNSKMQKEATTMGATKKGVTK